MSRSGVKEVVYVSEVRIIKLFEGLVYQFPKALVYI